MPVIYTIYQYIYIYIYIYISIDFIIEIQVGPVLTGCHREAVVTYPILEPDMLLGQILYTLAPMYLYKDYLKANVYIICVRGSLEP